MPPSAWAIAWPSASPARASASPARAAPSSSSARCSRSCGAATTRGSDAAISRAPFERALVALVGAALRVERLGAVCERVERRADGLGARKVERQVDVVDDRREVRAAAAADDAADPGCARRSSASTRRPSRSSAPTRPAVRTRPTRPAPCRWPSRRRPRARRRRRRGTSIRSDGISDQRANMRQVEAIPALARDEQRPFDAELGEHAGQLRERPADDQDAGSVEPRADHCSGARSRANSRKARVLRVSARPLERTR